MLNYLGNISMLSVLHTTTTTDINFGHFNLPPPMMGQLLLCNICCTKAHVILTPCRQFVVHVQLLHLILYCFTIQGKVLHI